MRQRGEIRSRPDLQTRFGERLREARHKAGLTRAALAESAGLTPRHVAKIEAGQINPTLATMAAVARLLGTEIGDMLCQAEPPAWVGDRLKPRK
jgi:transcriptional regulator with XRE-family HTH domain